MRNPFPQHLPASGDPSWWQSRTRELLTRVGLRRFAPELALFSAAPAALGVTVVTAFSSSRLYMLEGMCAGWRGALSAAVYQGVQAGSKHAFFQVQKAKAAVQELFERCARGRRVSPAKICVYFFL